MTQFNVFRTGTCPVCGETSGMFDSEQETVCQCGATLQRIEE